MIAVDILNLDAFNAMELKTDPFEYVVLPGFVRAERLALIRKDYPQLNKPGSIPLSQLTYGQGFKDFIDALDGTEFERAVSNKFSVDLAGKPTMFTVRAYCGATDAPPFMPGIRTTRQGGRDETHVAVPPSASAGLQSFSLSGRGVSTAGGDTAAFLLGGFL